MLKVTFAFIAAVFVTYFVGAVIATQSVMNRLADMGGPVNMSVRLQATLHDLPGMFPTYAPLVAIGLLAGFLVARLVLRFVPDWRTVGYACAGFVAIVATHLIMKSTFDITPVAVTRTALGLLAEGAAGLLGGWVFARLSALGT
jgi:hypothetical protein